MCHFNLDGAIIIIALQVSLKPCFSPAFYLLLMNSQNYAAYVFDGGIILLNDISLMVMFSFQFVCWPAVFSKPLHKITSNVFIM